MVAKQKQSGSQEGEKKQTDNLVIWLKSDTTRFIVGVLLLVVSVYLAMAFVSFFAKGSADQSLVQNQPVSEVLASEQPVQNGSGKIGVLLANLLINKGFGIPSSMFIIFLAAAGIKCVVKKSSIVVWKWFIHCMLIMVWGSLFLGSIFNHICPNLFYYPGGIHGSVTAKWLTGLFGGWGLWLMLLASALIYAVIVNRKTIDFLRQLSGNVGEWVPKHNPKPHTPMPLNDKPLEDTPQEDVAEAKDETHQEPSDNTAQYETTNENNSSTPTVTEQKQPTFIIEPTPIDEQPVVDDSHNITNEAEKETKNDTEVTPSEPYNPTLDLENYHYPTLDLLKAYEDHSPAIDMKEQNANKDRIIEVLRSFGVEIDSISATVGSTITLYEITPAQGVRIAKIRNLENDIALNLAAEGIRIIAPIPGKGTIGIEVPNANKKVVPIRDIIASRKFQESTMELPMAIGKTITNEVYMADLANAPHLLVAGATGQGKSVALNAIVTSLLYKKHPSELKFVIIDPKRVEFAIYGPIEQNFLAKLPDENNAIITDVTKVVQTLNSLCKEMDTRYELLQKAGCRNIKEYNEKFKARCLVPDEDTTPNCHKSGHHFLPYIVVIIDEFGDLILTAGKEVEFPIVRLAQMARAVGIHAIIATQRPTTNIITGSIKANFPARMALKVSAVVDSRTILDRSGAQQLIGRGDMLYLQGNEPVRVQCAFVDTSEVQNIAGYIKKQQSYPHAFILPEPDMGNDSSDVNEVVDLKNLDPLFVEAARLIIDNQQGSTSLIQRRMNLGYNRAGRIMDQLEVVGIVGPNLGSKPREVLCATEADLQMKLQTLNIK